MALPQESDAAREDNAVSDALVQFRQGELTFAEYLETRIELAVEHLRGRMSGDHLEIVRDVLRESLASDPVLEKDAAWLARRTPSDSLER